VRDERIRSTGGEQKSRGEGQDQAMGADVAILTARAPSSKGDSAAINFV